MPILELSFGSGEGTLYVRRFSAQEAISNLFTVSIWAASSNPSVNLAPLAGDTASLKIVTGWAFGGIRFWSGICHIAEQVHADPTGLSTYYIQIVPHLWLLTQRRAHRIFQRLSIPDIIDKLLAEWAIKHIWKIDKPAYPKLDYKVQYGESDYAFLSRLLEEAGIAFTFPEDPTKGSQLTFVDKPHKNTPHPAIRYVDNPNTAAEQEYITRVRLGHNVRPGALAIRDYDFRRPAFDAEGAATKAVAPEDRYEQFHYQPGSFLIETTDHSDTPVADDKGIFRHHDAAGKARAERNLQATRVTKRILSFETNTVNLLPGNVFSIDNHPRHEITPALPWLVTELHVDGSPEGAWSISGQAVSATVPYRPALKTPKPSIQGIQSATVVGPANQQIHTDEFGRVRVQFPWDREGTKDDKSSCWIRVSQGWAGTAYGMMLIPRIGQEVLVAFLEGDPDQPIIVGRVYNAMNAVPYKLPDNKTQSTWKSDTSPGSEGFNEILFEDLHDKELFYLQAQRNLRKLVKHDETITVVNNLEKLVEKNETDTTNADRTEVTHGDRTEITREMRMDVVDGSLEKLVSINEVERTEWDHLLFVGHDQHLVVKNIKRELIEVESHVLVKASRNEQVGGTQSLSVGGDQQERVDKNHALEAACEVHFKAGTAFVGEGAADVTVKGPGGFLRIDPSGVTIVGNLVRINEGGSPGSATDACPAGPEKPKEAEIDEPEPPKLTEADVRVSIKNEAGLKGGCRFIQKSKTHKYSAVGSPPEGTFKWTVSGQVSIVGSDSSHIVEVKGDTVSGSVDDSELTVEYTTRGKTAKDSIKLTVYELTEVKATHVPKPPAARAPDTSSTTDSRVFDASTMRVPRDGGDIKLKATVNPTGVPLQWDIERKADGKTEEPTHIADGGDTKRVVHSDATGSFHILVFVDCDADGRKAAGEGGLILNVTIENPCMSKIFDPLEVDELVSETISNAPPPYTQWNGTFGPWHSKFTLRVNRQTCRVTATIKIKVTGTITDAQKLAWKSSIESKWNNKVKLVCTDTKCPGACSGGYTISVAVEFVNSGEHYIVRANTPGATEGGRSGQGGTTSMTGWGVNDTVDVAHEFGHMLGNPEEYFTTNGTDYTFGGTRRGFRDPGAGIMNNPAGNPLPNNYDLIRRKAIQVMGSGTSCTTEVR